MPIYIGNLPYSAGQQDLDQAFSKYGRIVDISVPLSRGLNRPRGFAFMEMGSSAEEAKAIEALNGMELMGRTLKVTQARPKKDSSAKKVGQSWHRCIPFYRRPLFYSEDRFFSKA